jgi:hypothetical protein
MKYLMLAALAVSSVAWTQAPKAPPTLCIDDQCVTTPELPAVTSKKWHPGHYMQVMRGNTDAFNQSLRFSYYDAIGSNPNIAGVGVFYRWSQLEGARGDYAAGMALIRAEVAKLKSLPKPKRLAIRVMERHYSGVCPAIHYFPPYLEGAGKTFTTGISVKSCQWKRWDAEAMGWFIAMLEAYGKAFDGDPYVTLISPFHETSIAWGGSAPLAGFTEDVLDREMRRLALALKNAWPKTNVWIPTNWGLSGTRLERHIEYLASIAVGAGNPDVCPSCKMEIDLIMNRFTAPIPRMMSVEASEMGYNSVGPAGGFTAQQIQDYATDNQRTNYLFWDRNLGVGTTEQRWDTGILPVINSQPLKHLSCPLVYSACVQ